VTNTTLLDLGEREILRTIIPRFVTGGGDDCAFMPISTGTLVATTDPVPPPAAASIGRDKDPYWAGWLLVTINASDLAASGAQPLGFLAAIECSPDTPLDDFERVLAGVRDGCTTAGLSYVGGNLREATKFAAVGTAIGLCDSYRPLSRIGARAGDLLLSIGAGGVFWRDAIALLNGGDVASKDASPIYRPQSQIRIMAELARRGLVRAAMDNSDGLLPSLAELSAKNGLGIMLQLEKLTVAGVPASGTVDPARLWLGWGDWNVIAAVQPKDYEQIEQQARYFGTTISPLGLFTTEFSGVRVERRGVAREAPRLESERFAKDSWMLAGGVKKYADLLLNVPLPH
jgi:thiamine-monophosphate kinase